MSFGDDFLFIKILEIRLAHTTPLHTHLSSHPSPTCTVTTTNSEYQEKTTPPPTGTTMVCSVCWWGTWTAVSSASEKLSHEIRKWCQRKCTLYKNTSLSFTLSTHHTPPTPHSPHTTLSPPTLLHPHSSHPHPTLLHPQSTAVWDDLLSTRTLL